MAPARQVAAWSRRFSVRQPMWPRTCPIVLDVFRQPSYRSIASKQSITSARFHVRDPGTSNRLRVPTNISKGWKRDPIQASSSDFRSCTPIAIGSRRFFQRDWRFDPFSSCGECQIVYPRIHRNRFKASPFPPRHQRISLFCTGSTSLCAVGI